MVTSISLPTLTPRYLLREVADEFRLRRVINHDFSQEPFLLLYSMAKAGTSTVEASLSPVIDWPIYKVHNLASQTITEFENRSRTLGRNIPRIVKLSKVLEQKFQALESQPHIPWHTISLVREPIGHMLSNLFQALEGEWKPAELDDSGDDRIKLESALKLVQTRLAEKVGYASDIDPNSLGSDASTWFDRELKLNFQIDVYQQPYNREQGFSIFERDNVRCLVMRMEDIDRSLIKAIAHFLNVNLPEVRHANSGTGLNKNYSSAYRTLKQKIQISPELCERVYQTDYARHFYSEKEIATLIKKWSKDYQSV